MRQKTQRTLASATAATGEAPSAPARGPESRQAGRVIERQADTERLMEEVCEREHLKRALQRVRSNKASSINKLCILAMVSLDCGPWPTSKP